MTAGGTADVGTRHARIVELARAGGMVSVETLARTLKVTPQTIRKDLSLLERRLLLNRVHGGAVATSGTANLAYAERRDLAVAAKLEIGAAAAELVFEAYVFVGAVLGHGAARHVGVLAVAVALEKGVAARHLHPVGQLVHQPQAV